MGPPAIAPFIELERSSTTTTFGGSQTDGSAATARLVAASPIIAIAAHALVRMSPVFSKRRAGQRARPVSVA